VKRSFGFSMGFHFGQAGNDSRKGAEEQRAVIGDR